VPLSRSRDYLSIGEVLESLRPEWPDISVSKIRFLEAEGLIAPERTESGYRKFYDPDVQRLRYILSLQRDQFMPLKVIRERLSDIDANGSAYEAGPEATTEPAPKAAPSRSRRAADLVDVHMTRAELSRASGLSEQQLTGLEDFGILAAGDDGGYDGNDLALAQAASGLFEYGIEPRHLRMFRQTVDREVSFVEQIVSPVTRKRGAGAREEAAQSVRRLVDLSRQVRESLLRTSLKQLL
jgi:DNA-binding transcriptional MerR regulator